MRCRHEARAAARDRFNRLMLRGSAAAIVVAIVAAGIVAASNMRSRADTSTTVHAAAPIASAAPETIASPDTTPSIVVPPPIVEAAPAPVGPAAPFTPVLPMGPSSLVNGVTAMRSDTDVVVSFDLPDIRTRQAPKFEQIVRQTLGAVYGTPAVVFLDKIPDGGIASQGNLLTELPQRGVRIPLRPGWAIRVFPETRPGRDGPLVIRYRTYLAPTSE